MANGRKKLWEKVMGMFNVLVGRTNDWYNQLWKDQNVVKSSNSKLSAD